MLKATCSLWQWDDVEKQPWLIGLRKAHPTSSNSEKAPESPVRDETFHSTMCFIFSNFLHLGRFWQAKNHSNLPVSAATSPAVKHLSTKCSQRYSSDSLETGQFFDPLITSRALWNLHILYQGSSCPLLWANQLNTLPGDVLLLALKMVTVQLSSAAAKTNDMDSIPCVLLCTKTGMNFF
jgi:hypothetical protein